MTNWQKSLGEAAIRALDKGADKIGDEGEKVVHKLAKQWRSLDADDKRELMEVVAAVGGAILAGLAARKSPAKKQTAKKIASKAGKKVLKTVAKRVDKPVKKALKK
jgi:uncharacterized membrane protein